uniref:Uncharacterized protein n=1 Tax=Monodelphis domestica TaxID=13616 RepID=F7C3X2_MONDO
SPQVFTRLGRCFTFNSGADGAEVLTTLKGGAGNGLEIMLTVQQDEYLPLWKDRDETPYEAGFRVQIHSQDEPPTIEQLGFGVAPGYQTFVSCQKQQLSFLPQPWGDCSSVPSLKPVYSLAGCHQVCETKYLSRKCGCRMVYMPGKESLCPHEAEKTGERLEDSEESWNLTVITPHSPHRHMVRKDIGCSCPNACDSTRYAKELSMVRIPSRASASYLARKYNRSEQYIADNVLVLDIFFEALNYESVEQQKAYEVADLLGDIGGQMGLFIGASLLTILEILDFLFEVDWEPNICLGRNWDGWVLEIWQNTGPRSR